MFFLGLTFCRFDATAYTVHLAFVLRKNDANLVLIDSSYQGHTDVEQGSKIPRAPNHRGDAEEFQQGHKFFRQHSIFAPERP